MKRLRLMNQEKIERRRLRKLEQSKDSESWSNQKKIMK
jgi:hypothetical protein